MITEKEIKMAAKMYKCRDSAKSLANLKDIKYMDMIKPYINIFKQLEEKNVLLALLEISKTKAYNTDGVTQMLFIAAAIEIMEPSTDKP